MKKIILLFCFSLFSVFAFSQSAGVIQGVGAINMSMGGAATGQPLDISGALQWNPASISSFDNTSIKLDFGLFFVSSELSSSAPAGLFFPGDTRTFSGSTDNTRGPSPLPSLAVVWGNADSKHTFGLSVFAISGIGLTFPVEKNSPLDASGSLNLLFDGSANSNVIIYPQAAGGFGQIESDYMLMQLGFTYAYEISDKFSIGIEPTLDYGALQLIPNPTAAPNAFGYGNSSSTTSIGFGGQIGLYYNSGSGFKAGASYKTKQFFGDYDFENTFMDGSTNTTKYNLNFPSIISVGLGYSMDKFDFAADYRYVGYKNTEGLGESGWNADASVAGFGWENMSIISLGVQYKGIEKLPLRIGYTYNTVPITEELAFFSTPMPAVVNNGIQVGLSFIAGENFSIDAVYHHGMSGDVSGLLSSPRAIDPSTNPLGALPGTNVTYNMTTNLFMIGAGYTFNK